MGPIVLDLTLVLIVTLEPDSVTTLQDPRSAVQATDSSLLQIFEASSGAYPAFCSVGTGVLLWGQSGWGTKLSIYLVTLCSAAESKKAWSFTTAPTICLHGVHRGSITQHSNPESLNP